MRCCRWWTSYPHEPTQAADPQPRLSRIASSNRVCCSSVCAEPATSAEAKCVITPSSSRLGCPPQPFKHDLQLLADTQHPAAPCRCRSPDEPAAERLRHVARRQRPATPSAARSHTTGVSPCRTTASASSASRPDITRMSAVPWWRLQPLPAPHALPPPSAASVTPSHSRPGPRQHRSAHRCAMPIRIGLHDREHRHAGARGLRPAPCSLP